MPAIWFLFLTLLQPGLAPAADSGAKAKKAPELEQGLTDKQVIGATAFVEEATTGVSFPARIDTGAKTCSLHVEEVVIEDPQKDMRKNLNKKVRIRISDTQGKDHWIETKIAETVKVKTSEDHERRYKVWMTLHYGKVTKRVHVTLNDRSHMEYPLLVGRNFLRGEFLVDVEREQRLAKK